VPKQVHVVGARPNLIKAAPVIRALQERGADPVLVHTGQHYERELSDIFFDQLGIPEPYVNLGVGSGRQGAQTAALMVSIENFLIGAQPDEVVVYGDVNSTLAAALVAAKLHVPVAHVEAGLRSFDRSMPEELNRVITDVLASRHFTTSPEAADHLALEGIRREGIHFVGNTMIDTLLQVRERLDVDAARQRHELGDDYALCTLHRPANVDDHDVATELVKALGKVAKEIPILFSLHPRGRANMQDAGLFEVPGVTVTPPLGYLEFMALMSAAKLVLTDSGGIQEETTVLGVPCLTVRDNTERPITVSMGTNRLVGRDPDFIYKAAVEVLADPPHGSIPPLWDGQAGQRVAEILHG
jgi:UDP-N-acetylglucosamine 2-epimerase (non-hydrolysing)